jgi:DNA polymerase III subunit epsilon
MREIIFDTETTGLDNKEDRIIEIGGIELDNHFPTGRTLHLYFNSGGRKVHPDALAVHGITDDFLKDKPSFADMAEQILEFFEGAKWIAHNANFDMGFINSELARIGVPPIPGSEVIDTLALARRKHPMGPNSLDALCKRYGIDNSHRTKHGALLDSELLAEVYIEMKGGRQAALGFGGPGQANEEEDGEVVEPVSKRPQKIEPLLNAKERDAHEKMVGKIGVDAIWNRYQ